MPVIPGPPAIPSGSSGQGHTIDQWRTKIAALLADDAGLDANTEQIDEVGIRPALVEHFHHRPCELTVEAVGANSAYFPLPNGWATGVSDLLSVEYPARQNPPRPPLDHRCYGIGQDPSDVTVPKIWLDRTVGTGTYVRFTFLAPWPMPTDDPTDDLIPATQFEAVTMLAAAYCCERWHSIAARSRGGALPVDFSDGTQRADRIATLAAHYRDAYCNLVERWVSVA